MSSPVSNLIPIPNVLGSPITDKNGNLTADWKGVLTQLITNLQKNLSTEGYVLPHVSTDNITQIAAKDTSIGAMWYDNTTNEFKVNINGTVKVVQVV